MLKRIITLLILLNSVYCINCLDTLSWSNPQIIPGSQGAVNVALARDSQGNALVAWQAVLEKAHNVICTAYYTVSEKTWSSIKVLGSAYIQSRLRWPDGPSGAVSTVADGYHKELPEQ